MPGEACFPGGGRRGCGPALSRAGGGQAWGGPWTAVAEEATMGSELWSGCGAEEDAGK